MKRFLLTLTLVLFIAPIAIAQDLHSYIPTDGLVAYYPFNGNVNDTSGNNYNLVNNNVTYDSDRFGTDDSSAAYFSGNASELYLEESISQLTSDPRQTFTFWFKSITPSNRYIFEYASQSNARFRFVTSPTGGIGIRGETGCNSGGRDYVIPNLHEGWHHFVIAIDTQTYTVYYDGKVLYNASHSGFDCTDNVNKLNLGNDIGGGAKEYTNMLMDDIGIWNRVLSEQEIQNLYNSSTGDIILNGVVSAENNQIKNVADPTDAQDAVTKSYTETKFYTQSEVDGLIEGLQNQINNLHLQTTTEINFENLFDLETGDVCTDPEPMFCDSRFDLRFPYGGGDIKARLWWNESDVDVAFVYDKSFLEIQLSDVSSYYFCEHINDPNQACSNTGSPPTNFIGIYHTSEGNYYAVEYLNENTSNFKVSFRYKLLQ